MSNKNKNHLMAFTAVSMFINACVADSAQTESSHNREWTKEGIHSLIVQSTHDLVREKNYQEFEQKWSRLEDEVDAVSQYLIEILEEETEGLIIANLLLVISHSKTKHELFASAISNKLESFTDGSDYAREKLNRGAARTLGIFRQSRESANANIHDTGNESAQETVAAIPPTSEESAVQDESTTPVIASVSAKQPSWMWWLALPVACAAWLLFRIKKPNHVKEK